MLPSANAIMMVPMMMVHTICELEKYGASNRDAPSSAAMTAMPEKNSVTYRNSVERRIGRSLRVTIRVPAMLVLSFAYGNTIPSRALEWGHARHHAAMSHSGGRRVLPSTGPALRALAESGA